MRLGLGRPRRQSRHGLLGRRRRVGALGATALLAALATACGGHGRGPGTIVFQKTFESDGCCREATYTVRPDGSGLTKLLDHAYGFWTRDGTKALFDNGRASFVFEPASGIRRSIRLPENTELSGTPWAPDGKRLAFATDGGDIVIRDMENGLQRRIPNAGGIGPVAWMPDGKRVLFTAVDAVYAASAAGSLPGRVVRLPEDLSPSSTVPQWSGDGKWISLFDEGTKLYVVRADGTGLRSIAGLHRFARVSEEAAWSPTGERIAFTGDRGLVVLDLGTGRRRQLTRDPLDSSVAWSPDGERIVYTRDDLGRGADTYYHDQLWTMKADGTDQRPLTHAFPDDGSNGQAVWVGGDVNGTPLPRLPLVSLRGTRTIATGLPIVALAAAGSRAAVAQGLGGLRDFRGPLGPLVVWNPVRRNASRIPIPGCGSAYEVELEGVFLTGSGVGYRCAKPFVSYGEDDTLQLVRPGKRAVVIVHSQDSEFSGSFLGGLAGDGSEIAFDVRTLAVDRRGDVHTGQSRIWKATGARKAIVRKFPGEATVASLDRGRIAVLRDGHAVSVLFPGGGIRTFASGRRRILGAALDGPRLLVLEGTRLTVFDLETGRRTAAWPIRRGFGPPPVLNDVKGDLAAYVIGVAIHVLRLSDGREIVVQMPNATGPIFARFVPSGLFYSFNEAYDNRPGRLVFVARPELERALISRAAAP